MKIFILYTYIFSFALSVLGLAGFLYKLIIIINDDSTYIDYMQIAVTLSPWMGMGLIGSLVLLIVQKIRTKQQDKDQMRRILEQEKVRKE